MSRPRPWVSAALAAAISGTLPRLDRAAEPGPRVGDRDEDRVLLLGDALHGVDQVRESGRRAAAAGPGSGPAPGSPVSSIVWIVLYPHPAVSDREHDEREGDPRASASSLISELKLIHELRRARHGVQVLLEFRRLAAPSALAPALHRRHRERSPPARPAGPPPRPPAPRAPRHRPAREGQQRTQQHQDRAALAAASCPEPLGRRPPRPRSPAAGAAACRGARARAPGAGRPALAPAPCRADRRRAARW